MAVTTCRVRVAQHLGDAGRGERATREDLRIRVPRNDVDPLATELVDDRLHPRAFEPDACTDRVDRFVTAVHRDLRATSHLSRDLADLDDALMDLRAPPG